MFKRDKNGNDYFTDGQMLPANISRNNNDIGTDKIDAIKFFKTFPI